MTEKIMIEMKNFTKEIKNEIILDNINFKLYSKKIYGFIGHNGSGKSMIFKSICGLVKGQKGEIIVEGQNIGKNINFPINTGILIEQPGFLPQYSGFQNLKLLAAICNKIDDKQIIETIKLVGLDPNDKKPVKKYSLGMKQRLGIAQAIMEDPKIIILDEPMNGLDDEGITIIRNLILELKNKNKIILLASHNKEDIDLLCDTVFKLNKGKIIETYTK